MEKNIREQIKTSYSLSVESYIELQNSAELCGISAQKLLKIVMAGYVRKLHKHLITDGNVITYNKHGKEGYKKLYITWSAKEYVIILQLKFNTRYSTSYLLESALKKLLSRIVMAILKRKMNSKPLSRDFFQNLLLKLERFYTYWPNIDIHSSILPFFQMHLDYSLF